ncbi:hypothetical protein [Nonomuraea candida]|uniref:hypothetical protein n=1 Tax=Nonomuraea candida TaxID=359159 RepID=UPI0012FC1AB4|nr:hypothetical protein [Nonomuraea candida]
MAEINWHVINNGLDFLKSSVELLADGSERDAKYAALHPERKLRDLAQGPPGA